MGFGPKAAVFPRFSLFFSKFFHKSSMLLRSFKHASRPFRAVRCGSSSRTAKRRKALSWPSAVPSSPGSSCPPRGMWGPTSSSWSACWWRRTASDPRGKADFAPFRRETPAKSTCFHRIFMDFHRFSSTFEGLERLSAGEKRPQLFPHIQHLKHILEANREVMQSMSAEASEVGLR